MKKVFLGHLSTSKAFCSKIFSKSLTKFLMRSWFNFRKIERESERSDLKRFSFYFTIKTKAWSFRIAFIDFSIVYKLSDNNLFLLYKKNEKCRNRHSCLRLKHMNDSILSRYTDFSRIRLSSTESHESLFFRFPNHRPSFTPSSAVGLGPLLYFMFRFWNPLKWEENFLQTRRWKMFLSFLDEDENSIFISS